MKMIEIVVMIYRLLMSRSWVVDGKYWSNIRPRARQVPDQQNLQKSSTRDTFPSARTLPKSLAGLLKWFSTWCWLHRANMSAWWHNFRSILGLGLLVTMTGSTDGWFCREIIIVMTEYDHNCDHQCNYQYDHRYDRQCNHMIFSPSHLPTSAICHKPPPLTRPAKSHNRIIITYHLIIVTISS